MIKKKGNLMLGSKLCRFKSRNSSIIASLAMVGMASRCSIANEVSDPSSAGSSTPKTFAKIGELSVAINGSSRAAEILAASTEMQTMIYTGSPAEALSFADISHASAPAADGMHALGGEPTSRAVKGGYALVAVNWQSATD